MENKLSDKPFLSNWAGGWLGNLPAGNWMRSSPVRLPKTALVYAAERRAGDRSHLHRSARRDRAAGLARPLSPSGRFRRSARRDRLAGNIPLVGFFRPAVRLHLRAPLFRKTFLEGSRADGLCRGAVASDRARNAGRSAGRGYAAGRPDRDRKRFDPELFLGSVTGNAVAVAR